MNPVRINNVPAASFFSTAGGGVTVGGAVVTTDTFAEVLQENLVVRETLKEVDDPLPEDERTFSTTFNIKPNTESVFLNGLIQSSGANNDYVIVGTKQVVFNVDDGGESFVEIDDEVVISYVKG